MTKIELENKHMMAKHELNRLRGNACAFCLRAEMSKDEKQKQANLKTVAYFDQEAEKVKLWISDLETSIAAFN